MKEKIWEGVIGFFVCGLLLYLGARLVMRVWWVLLIVTVIALAVIIYIRFKKGKPKY